MENYTLLDVATEVGYELAMAGAETFRVEESITRILAAYGIEAAAFAIPNNLTVSIKKDDGTTATYMRRIGEHGNDLDAVERFNNLSRRICAEKPSPDQAVKLLNQVKQSKVSYSLPMLILGNFLTALGFTIFFGGTFADSICSGIGGIIIGLTCIYMEKLKVNVFFKTIAASFFMTFFAYALSFSGITRYTDTIVIGALMLLVPGLLFTNSLRDVLFGDTNSGLQRLVQVLLIAVAIAIGTGAAWTLCSSIWRIPIIIEAPGYSYLIQCLAAIVACHGFALLFNIHGPGTFLCSLGAGITWAVYCITYHYSHNEVLGYFFAAIAAGVYSEVMARIRKYPATSYLIISCFPLFPGAGVYYTANYIVRGNMAKVPGTAVHTVALAGAIAVGILMVLTVIRSWTVWKQKRR